jgi:ubiquinone/menaquinone biosynthesis C-methylase UbiE
MNNKAEDNVSEFYNSIGWKTEKGIAEDTKRYEDLREYAEKYVSKCRFRVLRHIPDKGENILDMGSGPIPHKEYLEYSKNFKKRYCVDLSSEALEMAREKIGDHGVFLHGSIFDVTLDENFFDCAISLFVIFHIDKVLQEKAVRKLIYVTKPRKPVIIVYTNPNTFLTHNGVRLPFRLLKIAKSIFIKPEMKIIHQDDFSLYSYAHPIEWWNRFSDIANVKILPFRSFDTDTQKKLIPDNKIGRKMFDILFNLEDRFPNFFVKHFQYPMIILTKKTS